MLRCPRWGRIGGAIEFYTAAARSGVGGTVPGPTAGSELGALSEVVLPVAAEVAATAVVSKEGAFLLSLDSRL